MSAEPAGGWMRSTVLNMIRTGRLPALCVVLACAISLYAFLNLSDYQVDTVVVRGATIGDPGQVADASGALGRSIFRIDPDATARAIAQLPWVAKVAVRLQSPDTLVVSLVERVPVAVWVQGGQSVLVDSNGQVLYAGDAASLPHVRIDDEPLAIGSAVEPADVAAVVALHESLGPELVELAWHDLGGFEATLTDERVVVFGDATQMPLKLAALRGILAQVDQTWSFLDLSEPERPYFR
ncbi:MAG: hypothetical protein DCC58_13965 [Chloroflexi bacterium]|nr:MAG: hypothetical protein DCC58_13965 [Chloroflexota bacterium]